MFRSFVLFIAAHYYFSGCNVFPYILNFCVTFFIGTYYLALSISGLLLERLSMTFTANGKNETFAVCLQLSVK